MGICRLCLKDTQLRDSHIIPRSFIKKVKGKSAQLIKMNVGTSSKPKLENADWKEKLFCGDCEQLLSNKYEATQLAYLRNGRITQKHPNRVTFSSFHFEKFYLFWLSILWRASISSLPDFKHVDLGSEMNDCLARMIAEERMNEGNICISQLIHIGIVKILPSEGFSQSTIRKVLCSFYLKKEADSVFYYSIIEGFMICFCLAGELGKELPKNFGRIKKTFNLRIPALHIQEDTNLTDIFNKMINYAKQNEGWR